MCVNPRARNPIGLGKRLGTQTFYGITVTLGSNLIHSVQQSRLWGKALGLGVVCLQIGAALLNGLKGAEFAQG